MTRDEKESHPFTDEDRARIQRKAELASIKDAWNDEHAFAAARALAYIDHLEGAVEAADKVSEAVDQFSILAGMFDPEKSRAVHANDHYRSARKRWRRGR